jgi:hypothetical protein
MSTFLSLLNILSSFPLILILFRGGGGGFFHLPPPNRKFSSETPFSSLADFDHPLSNRW